MALSAQAMDEKRRAAEGMLGALALPEGEAGWAREARARARTRLLDAGAPARRDEYWRYTDPARLTLAEAPPEGTASPPPAGAFGDRAARVVRFVDGRFRPELSDALQQPGLEVLTLSEALTGDITFARELFGALEAAGQEKVARPLASLNTAAATEGVALHVTGEVPEPVHIAQVQATKGAGHLHHVVRVEPGGAVTLLESGLAANSVLEVDIAPGGRFSHVRLQEAADRPTATHLFARVGTGAAFQTFTLTADGALTRNEVVVDLTGDDATGRVAGAVLARGQAHVDNTVFVTHSARGCESRQVFKNVLDGEAKGIFQGKIFVRQPAQKTDGYQISQSILLADGAEFSAKPELEIYADDVKCSHGSTTGALDATALFYLMSRGIERREAEALLVASFVEEAVLEIADEGLQEVIRQAVVGWMSARS